MSAVGEIDRISQLRESVVYRILCFLFQSPLELVRISVLSKTWFNRTASFPHLEFDMNHFTQVLSLSRQSFFKYVEYTTSRFCHHNLTVDKLRLLTSLEEPAEVDIVNRCLESVFKKGVKVLVVDFDTPNYHFPASILLSIPMLKNLGMRACELPSSLVIDHAVKFNSLKTLHLEKVNITDEGITYLTTSCPLLRELSILNCRGFKRFCVYGHQHLRKVRFQHDTRVDIIDIEAAKLNDLCIVNKSGIGAPQMNVASCRKLTTVTYAGRPLPNSDGFNYFLPNFPFIENLILVTSYKCENLKLSSHSLRTLVLYAKFDLEDIEFSTPNLVLFVLPSNPNLFWPVVTDKRWPLLRDSTHLKPCMRCYPYGPIDALWFQKLRHFFDKESGFKPLNLYINTEYSLFTELEKLKSIEFPTYELEHVELQVDTTEESSADVAFVDAVRWCFSPRSLTLRSSSYN